MVCRFHDLCKLGRKQMPAGMREPVSLANAAAPAAEAENGTPVFMLKLPTVTELGRPGPSRLPEQYVYHAIQTEVDGKPVQRLPNGRVEVGGTEATLLTEASHIASQDSISQ